MMTPRTLRLAALAFALSVQIGMVLTYGGDRFLDRFVAPYAYGGLLLFDSGKQFEFTVYRNPRMDGWGVFLDAPGALRERW
jgi:hypothetical protein